MMGLKDAAGFLSPFSGLARACVTVPIPGAHEAPFSPEALAEAARGVGLGDVPLICARELSVRDGTPRCIRVLMHMTTERARADLRHVYLEGARSLRDDLPG